MDPEGGILYCAQQFAFVVFNIFLVYDRFKEFVNGTYGADGAIFSRGRGPNFMLVYRTYSFTKIGELLDKVPENTSRNFIVTSSLCLPLLSTGFAIFQNQRTNAFCFLLYL